MAKVKHVATAAVIGDLVGSREQADRAAVHATLAAAVDRVNAEQDPVTPLRITVGDEYQGTFGTVGQAIRAALRLRLALLPDLDARHGIGWGEVTVLSDDPRVEDGPGWWVARDAIKHVETASDKAALRQVRTAYRLSDGAEGPPEASVNAALLGLDGLLAAMSERSLGVLRGLLAGHTQREIAEAEGISASAVSQRVRNDAVGLVMAMDKTLGGVG